ncbi:hypothetical protein Tco_0117260 [Tanacetum coccineum]
MKNSRYLWLQDPLEGLGKVSTCFVFFESSYVCGDGMISGDIIEEDGFSCEEGGGSECGRKAHLLEDKQIPSVGVFDEVYFAFGWHLDDLHVTWAHLEKKRTRLRTKTKTLEDISLQTLETGSGALQDAVSVHQATASQDLTTASARADSKADLEDSSHDGVTPKK